MKKDSLSDRFFLHNMPFIPPFRHRFACMVLFLSIPCGLAAEDKGAGKKTDAEVQSLEDDEKNASLADLLRRFETDDEGESFYER